MAKYRIIKRVFGDGKVKYYPQIKTKWYYGWEFMNWEGRKILKNWIGYDTFELAENAIIEHKEDKINSNYTDDIINI